MRFEVPQFIEVEDKIFGPFTWKQFLYLIGGCGFAAVLFFTTNFFIFVIFGLPIGGLSLLLTFYRVNNRPFSVYLEAMLRFMSGTKLYLWRKKSSAVYTDAHQVATTTSNEIEAAVAQNMHVPTVKKENLSNLAHNLELDAIAKES